MRIKNLLALCATFTLVAACSDDSGPGDGYTTTDTLGDTDDTDTDDSNGETMGDGDGDAATDTEDTTDDSSGDDGIPIEPDNMIDNFEDGDGALIPNGGRQGYWYTYNDESEGASQTPAADMVLPEAGGAVGTGLAMHTTGSGFTEWGAGIGIDLNNAGDPDGGNGIKMPWDASSYTGIVLRAKGSGQIRAAVQISATIPPEEGGTCEMDCDPHGKVMLLSEEWQEYTLEFATINQEGWGTPAAWDASTVVGLQFKANAGADFDFWIDEIGFY